MSEEPYLAATDRHPSRHEEGARLAWRFLVLALVLRVIFLLISANNGGDALDRAAKAEEWLENLHLQFFYGAWLPLHFWIMGAIGTLLGNVELGGRLFSLATGSASVWLVWRIARRAFGPNAGLLSLCAMAFYTTHVGYSTASSAEVPFLFFSLLGLDLLFAHQQDGALRKLVASGLCFTLGAAIRYEAWVMIAAAGLVLVGSPRALLRANWWSAGRILRLALFGCTAGAWPIFWMTYSYFELGHPLYYVAMQRLWVPGINEGTSFAYRLSVAPVSLVLGLSVLVAAAAAYALWLSLREPAVRPLAFIYLFYAGSQFYQTVTQGMWPSARFTIAQGALLAVLGGFGIERAARKLVPLWGAAKICIVTSMVLVLNLGAVWALSEVRHPYSEKFGSISPRLRFTHNIQDVGNFLRPRLRSDEPVVFDNYNVESSLLATASGLPLRPGEHVFLAVRRKPEELQPFLQDRRPRYLVYARGGDLNAVLTLPTDCSSATVWDIEFRCVFSNQTYSIFELTYR